MSNNYNCDEIKAELFSLCKKYLPDERREEIDRNVNIQMRKLSCLKSILPSVSDIESDIATKMKHNGSSETAVLQTKSYCRQIQNLNVRNPAGLIFFLKEMSNIGSELSDSKVSNRTTPITQPVDARTSSPSYRNNFHANRLPKADVPRESIVNRFSNQQSIFIEPKTTHTNAIIDRAPTLGQSILVEPKRNIANDPFTRSSNNYQISNKLTEFTVIGELLFMILGNDGKYLTWNQDLQELSIREGAVLPHCMHEHVLLLCQCGAAYRRIRHYIDNGFNNVGSGVVYQGFCVALSDSLSSYVNLVAALQRQYNNWSAEVEHKCNQNYSQNRLTLTMLLLKLHEPMEMLCFLVSILDGAEGLRGGQLASVIYGHIIHGDREKVRLVRNLLLHSVEPFYNFIQQWIYDGILEESHEDFFVEINYNCDLNLSWTDKYALKAPMIPNFITDSQAQKILLAGKSINFLREVCGENPTFRSRKEVAATMSVTAEDMINQVVDRKFDNAINSVCAVTGEYLLNVILDRYQLMDHLNALRKYMLHEQGDFILRLIEIMDPCLSKPANELKANHIKGSLKMAIKSTTAQYDSRDILARFGIHLMKMTERESGWDIFTLKYQIDDVQPLYAVINRSSFSGYSRAFNILFRTRRVHFILNRFFKERNSCHKSFKKVLEVSSVLHFSNVMVMDMLHFVNQVQCYINFELLESSWKRFMDSMSKATNLDSVMKHHEYFVKQVTTRCLLEPESLDLLSNLITVYDIIIAFELLLNDMFSTFKDELRFRTAYQEQIDAMKKQDTWGVDDRREWQEKQRIRTFTKTDVVQFQNKLRDLSSQYESQLVKFLSTIVNHHDSGLRCLYANLDFNGRYKGRIKEYQRKPQLNTL